MTIQEYKKVRVIIKQALAELQAEAIKGGFDLMSADYEQAQEKVKQDVLAKFGLDYQEYTDIANSSKKVTKTTVGYSLEQLKRQQAKNDQQTNKTIADLSTRIDSVERKPIKWSALPDKPEVLTKDQINALIADAITRLPKPKDPVVNVTEVKNVVEKTTVNYDDAWMKDELNRIEARIASGLEEVVYKNSLADAVNEQINMFGMPDFRKLAMGLRDDIDKLRSSGAGVSSLNTLSGAVTLAAGSNITLTPVGNTITIAASGGGGGATVALDNLASVAINTSLLLGTSDGGALGSTSKMWSDLFLAAGGVINFSNGDVTITHGTNYLQFSGAFFGYLFDAQINIDTSDAPVVSITGDGTPYGPQLQLINNGTNGRSWKIISTSNSDSSPYFGGSTLYIISNNQSVFELQAHDLGGSMMLDTNSASYGTTDSGGNQIQGATLDVSLGLTTAHFLGGIFTGLT